MTFDDAYVTVTRLALLLTPVVLLGWWIDHKENLRQAWREYRRRHADFVTARRLCSAHPGFPHVVRSAAWADATTAERQHLIRVARGAGVLIIPDELAVNDSTLDADMAEALRKPVHRLDGPHWTRDPSPTPRRTR